MTDAPRLKHFARLRVTVEKPQEVGETQRGRRRLIPITGGTVEGHGWAGRVLAGGADYQLILTPRITELDARYTLQTDDGDLIYVHNSAIRVATPEVTEKLARNEPVDPSLIYFRCTPVFETASESLSWINERLFVGTGVRRPDAVEMELYEIA